MEETLQPLRPYDPMDTLKQFLDHDRHVLRFYCYWDDRDEMFGDVRYMTLHYYLSDDTIEVSALRSAVPFFIGLDSLCEGPPHSPSLDPRRP